MMTENSNELLDGVTHEELSACIRLLAFSVVQHRAKSGFVAIEKSMTELISGTEETEEYGLFVQGKEVLEEALEMAKSFASGSPTEPETEETPGTRPAESRTQFRISVTAPIKVLWPEAAEPVEAKLENISWGGAAIHVARPKGSKADTLQIILPSTQSGSITIEAEIVRTWDLPDDDSEVMAIRFSSLSTRDEEELENVLEVLAESGDSDGQRKYARLTQRLDIQFDDFQELHATLEDISAGGLGITVPEPLQLGHSFQAVISTFDERCSLKLRARVVHQKPIKLGQTEVFQVGLEFEHPPEELRDRINELVREMATMKPPRNLGHH